MNDFTRRLLFTPAALAAVVAMAACESATAPDDMDDTLLVSAAVVAADGVLEDLSFMGAPFALGPQGAGGPGGGGAFLPGRPGQGHRLGGEFSGTRSVTFLDADGVEQDRYDPVTTAEIHFVMELEGEVRRQVWTATVSRTRDMTVSGLAGEETTRTFDGTGAEDVFRSRYAEDGSEHTFDMSGAVTWEEVVVPVPGSDARWPLSGTITRHMSVEVVGGPHGDHSRTVTVVITFDGDSTATADVDGETFEIDLDTRPGGFPLRGRRGQRGGHGP